MIDIDLVKKVRGYTEESEKNGFEVLTVPLRDLFPLLGRVETAERERDDLRAEIARRDAAAGEPVAVLYRNGDVLTKAECGEYFEICCKVETPLYTTAPPAVLPPEKITEIMQDAWNEFCDDTGCYPDDFEYQNEQLFFDAGRWAMLVAERISSLGAQQQKAVELPETHWTFDDDLNPTFDADKIIAALDAANVKWEVKK